MSKGVKSLVSGFMSQKASKSANKQTTKKATGKKENPARELVPFSNYIYADNLKWLKLKAIDQDKKIVDILNEMIDKAKRG